VMST